MSKFVGGLLVFGGLFVAACMFWATVFDGVPGSWQGRALWVAWLVVSVLLAIIGGALLVRDSEEK